MHSARDSATHPRQLRVRLRGCFSLSQRILWASGESAPAWRHKEGPRSSTMGMQTDSVKPGGTSHLPTGPGRHAGDSDAAKATRRGSFHLPGCAVRQCGQMRPRRGNWGSQGCQDSGERKTTDREAGKGNQTSCDLCRQDRVQTSSPTNMTTTKRKISLFWEAAVPTTLFAEYQVCKSKLLKKKSATRGLF